VTAADWLTLPTADWAGSLVGLALGVVSAAAAVFSSTHLNWIAELESATDATFDANGGKRVATTADGARAYDRLKKHRARDPTKSIGRIALAVSGFMTVLGVIAGLQIPKVGWFYTIVPILVAALVSVVAVFVPGRSARSSADARLREMAPPRPNAAGTPQAN
jgi:hypothetical protein